MNKFLKEAIKLYKPYFDRGMTLEQIVKSHMGSWILDVHIQTGGYFQEKKLKPNEVVVEIGKEFEKFKLEDIYVLSKKRK